MKQSLTAYHTFHLPVFANRIVNVHTPAELLHEWQHATAQNEPVLLIGQGSNLLFLDDFEGTVIRNQLKGITHTQDDNFHYLYVAGGEIWHDLVEWSLAQGINGLENLALIPGCAGTAPIQNIGAYGVEFEDVCDFVEVLNLHTGEIFKLSKAECEFGYRDSIFKHRYQDGYAIIAVGLKLPKAWQPELGYGTLGQFDPQAVTSAEIFAEVCMVRRAKLPNPDELGNAGSFFKNPIVSVEIFDNIAAHHPMIPFYDIDEDSLKLSAGWLIEKCGLKGERIGGAQVHLFQALVLVNLGKATGKDVLALAKSVRRQVREKFGVDLHPEVRFIGEHGEVDSEKATR